MPGSNDFPLRYKLLPQVEDAIVTTLLTELTKLETPLVNFLPVWMSVPIEDTFLHRLVRGMFSGTETSMIVNSYLRLKLRLEFQPLNILIAPLDPTIGSRPHYEAFPMVPEMIRVRDWQDITLEKALQRVLSPKRFSHGTSETILHSQTEKSEPQLNQSSAPSETNVNDLISRMEEAEKRIKNTP